MDILFSYLIKSSLSIAVFYIFYALMLRKETSFGWNRMYLLSAGIISLITPLISIGGISAEYTYMLQDVYISPVRTFSSEIHSGSYPVSTAQLLLIIYFSGVLVFSVRLLFGFFHLYRTYISGRRTLLGDIEPVIIKNGSAPFSFFDLIFIPEAMLNDQNLDKMLMHEKIHVKKLHSLDTLIYQLFCIVLWFNPFSWLSKKELQAQHEFAADSHVLGSGFARKTYTDLLFSYTFEIPGINITNNFSTLLKRRFQMISNDKHSNTGKLKVLFSLPLFMLIFLASVSVNNAGVISLTPQQDDSKVYEKADQMPIFPGGDEALMNFISSSVNYPKTAKDNGIQGKTFISFIVEKDGSVAKAVVEKGFDPECDGEALKCVKSMPKWQPGKNKGNPVRVKMVMPFTFKLQ